MDEEIKATEEHSASDQTLPVLPLRGGVLFPGVVVPIAVGREPSQKIIDEVLSQGKRTVAVIAQKNPDVEEPTPEDLFEWGVRARILQMFRLPNQVMRVILQGVDRIRVHAWLQTTPYLLAEVEPVVPPQVEPTEEIEALRQSLLKNLEEWIHLNLEDEKVPEEFWSLVTSAEDLGGLVDLIAAHLPFLSLEDKQRLLETLDPRERAMEMLRRLQREIEILRISKKIQDEVHSEISKGQREYILREQLKAIQKELGMIDDRERELQELQEAIEKARLPEQAREVALKEWGRLQWVQPSSPEYNVIRTYLDWILALPWEVETRDRLDLRKVQRILDRDHYDLERVKERVIEFLAVRKLKKDVKGPILCFLGPPGVGKTSLGRSIAQALGRQFVRISLGGVRDEAEIRGHRRTYIGALPGRIIQALRQAGSRNPVFMLDEVDKVGTDFRGDPASALLEVLDPEQNHAFVDHYLDIPFDLSRVLFIATANMVDTIPPPLLDRMEVIEIPGYIDQDKLKIAQKYLIPRVLQENGLEKAVSFSRRAILEIIRGYTREAGVRNLERNIHAIARKIAREITSQPEPPSRFSVTTRNLSHYLGPRRYAPDLILPRCEVGVVPGLAWTPVGGEVLYVEVLMMPGGKNLILTGRIGKVMEESAQAALSLLRARAKAYGIDPEFYERYDFHIHIPEGAVPKDGPSAGITIFAALASRLRDLPPRHGLAMTGEITLTGRVLPVGGIKEKVTAAHRTGYTDVLLPRFNEKDLEEIPERIRKDLTFHFVDHVDEALAIIFPS